MSKVSNIGGDVHVISKDRLFNAIGEEKMRAAFTERCVVCGSESMQTHAYIGTEDSLGLPCLDVCNDCMGIARKTSDLLGVDLDLVCELNAAGANVPSILRNMHRIYCEEGARCRTRRSWISM